MKGLLLVLLVAVSVSAQPTEPPPRHDKYRDDPHAFCYKGPEEGSAHACACLLVCAPNAEGNLVQQETTACGMYCTKSRCLCHHDTSCEPPDLR